MNWQELLTQPNGIIFCQDDIASSPLFIKLDSTANDILTEPLFDPDDGHRLFGLSDMDDCTRNSLQFFVLSKTDRDKLIRKLNKSKIFTKIYTPEIIKL